MGSSSVQTGTEIPRAHGWVVIHLAMQLSLSEWDLPAQGGTKVLTGEAQTKSNIEYKKV